MMRAESKQSPQPQDQKEANPEAANGQNTESMFSPRFKSVAAMAGWDEEAILVATLVVEDTPDRESKQKRRFDLQFKTPPSNSRRKRMVQKRSPVSTPIMVLDLDEEQSARQESNESDKKTEQLNEEKKTKEEKRIGEDELNEQGTGVSCSNSVLPCMDKLRDELSCAICLDICFEPSTTSCGHSFCKKCLRSAADKCGKKCPKCRQLISNGRSCTVNTVLWNAIQLLFPQEVEARKAAGALSSREAEHHQSTQGVVEANVRTRSMRYSSAAASNRDANLARLISRSPDNLESENQNHQRRRSIRHSRVSSRDDTSMRRRGTPSQDEDAALALRLERENLARMLSRDASARRRGGTRSENEEEEDAVLALRLQREEFMEAFRGSHEQQQTGSSLSSARANLRAMASRAVNIRMRGRPL